MNLLIASKVDQGDEFFMEGMDKKFGSIEFLSVQVARKVESIIDYLEESGEYYNIYYGYPIIDENDEKEYVKDGFYNVRINNTAQTTYSTDPGIVQLDDCIMAISNQTTIIIRQQTSYRSWGL